MIVIDASAVLEVLLRTDAGDALLDRIVERRETIAAPHLLDIEVAQVLGRYVARGELTADRGRQAVEVLRMMPLMRYGHEPLLERVWELRDDFTAYDAAYIALAEGLDAVLVTADSRLAQAPGSRATVELI